MNYDFVLIDKIFCECFIKWTYEEDYSTTGRRGLFDLHLRSAMKKSNCKPCLLALSSVTREYLEKQYRNNDRDMCHLSSIIEATEEIKIPICIEESEAILKSASLLKWKGFHFCILTGNSLIYDLAKKDGFEVYDLKESEEVFGKTSI